MTCCFGDGVSVWKNSQWVCNDCGSIKSNDPDYLFGGTKGITSTTGCKHEFVSYTGLNETFEFCKVCDARR